MRKLLLGLGALLAPLGLGTLMLFMTHRWKLLDPRNDAFIWFPLVVGLVCYLAFLDSWPKRILLGLLYLFVMFVAWFCWGVTFGCLQFGTCL
jgi:hypothetical protein